MRPLTVIDIIEFVKCQMIGNNIQIIHILIGLLCYTEQ